MAGLGDLNRQPELRSRQPGLYERLVARFGELLGDDQAAHQMARDIIGTDDPEKQAVIDAAHIGAYATPAAPFVGAYDLGSIAGDLVSPIKNAWDSFWEPKSQFDEGELTRDEFYSKRRSKRSTLQDAQTDAEKSVRESQAYKDAIASGKRTTAQRMIDSARTNAVKGWEADQRSIGDEDKRIEADWQAELSDRKSRSDALARKPWYERYPGSGEAAIAAGSAISALLAKRGFGKIAEEGNRLLKTATDARASGNLLKEAEALSAIDAWRKRMPYEYTKTGIKAAAVPLELRGVGTAADAMTMPELHDEAGNIDPTSARQQARSIIHKAISTPEGFTEEVGLPLLSGLTGVGAGSIFAKKPQLSEITAQRAFLPAGRATSSPDEAAVLLGDQRAVALKKQRKLDEIRAKPIKDPKAEPTPQAPAFQSIESGAQTGGPLLPTGPAQADIGLGAARRPSKPKSGTEEGLGGLSGKAASNRRKSSFETLEQIPEPRSPAEAEMRSFLIPRSAPNPKDYGFAEGGVVPEGVEDFELGFSGPLTSPVPGRTDHLPLEVTAGSFVIPADVVSALGEGNTSAGIEVLGEMFPEEAPQLVFAAGGRVPIMAAGGEHVLSPEQVAKVGGGDLNRGHDVLDTFVLSVRKDHINTLKALPGPAK